jgi:hypothetical protein
VELSDKGGIFVKKILNIANVVFGVLLGIGPWTIFKVCDSSEMVMRCTYSSRMITLFGILIALFGTFSIFTSLNKEKTANLLLCIIYS